MTYYEKNKTKILIQCKQYRIRKKKEIQERRLKFKIEVFSHYGQVCNCCGESNIHFLTIDHVGGGGNAHRRTNKIWSGTSTYIWLRKNNYPTGFQVLCFNCNMAKRTSDVCPHKLYHIQLGEE